MEKWGKEELTERIIKACMKVHAELGPGYAENIYHNALAIELPLQELSFESEKRSGYIARAKISAFTSSISWSPETS